MKKYFVGAIIPLLLLAACKKELNDAALSGNVPVVKSYINCGDSTISVNLFKITLYDSELTSDTVVLTGLNVYINDSLMSETTSGLYTYKPAQGVIKENGVYTLKFEYYNKSITTTTTIPAKPENFTISQTSVETARIDSGSMGQGPDAFDPVELSWDNPDANYFFLAVTYMESTEDYIDANMKDMDLPKMRNSEPNKMSVFDLTGRDLQFFGTYRIVLYRVNKEYAELYENVSSNSNNLTNPVSNIENAWGIFTGINSDTVYLEVKEE
jgi:hypothetical protein